jgi:glycine betaine/proline transport system substrate-binding protein
MEQMPANWLDWYKEQTAAGNVVDLKENPIMEGQPQFYIVPKWFAGQYNIKSIEDMKRPEVVKALADPEDPTKGGFVDCIIGWQCEAINKAKFRAYGLGKYYNMIAPGSSGAMEAAIDGPARRHQPVFAYYWSPTALMGRYDWYIIPEPPYTDACWDEIQKGRDDKNHIPKMACAYQDYPVTKMVYKTLPQQAPDAVALINKIQVGVDENNKLAAWAKDNNVQDWTRTAVKFLRENEVKWTTWLPANKAQRVKNALAKEPATS